MAKLNMARSRIRPAICSLVRIDQTRLGRRGGLAPINLPLFQGSRRGAWGNATKWSCIVVLLCCKRRIRTRPLVLRPSNERWLVDLSGRGMNLAADRQVTGCRIMAVRRNPKSSSNGESSNRGGPFLLNRRDQEELWRFLAALLSSPEDLKELWRFANEDHGRACPGAWRSNALALRRSQCSIRWPNSWLAQPTPPSRNAKRISGKRLVTPLKKSPWGSHGRRRRNGRCGCSEVRGRQVQALAPRDAVEGRRDAQFDAFRPDRSRGPIRRAIVDEPCIIPTVRRTHGSAVLASGRFPVYVLVTSTDNEQGGNDE
jgi:hypothetical protein